MCQRHHESCAHDALENQDRSARERRLIRLLQNDPVSAPQSPADIVLKKQIHDAQAFSAGALAYGIFVLSHTTGE